MKKSYDVVKFANGRYGARLTQTYGVFFSKTHTYYFFGVDGHPWITPEYIYDNASYATYEEAKAILDKHIDPTGTVVYG